MKFGMRMLGILICLTLVPATVRAQDQAKSSSQEVLKHLRIDFLLTEYNGQEKISSMPYTMYVEAASHSVRPGSLRMGVRVPLPEGANQFQYTDVGTDIDCSARVAEDDSYNLDLSVDRSSVYSPDGKQSETDAIRGSAGGEPVIRKFSSFSNLKMRDGETMEGSSAADPFNGHVLKVTVTLHVLK